MDDRWRDWRQWIHARALELAHVHEADNFDSYRYRVESPTEFAVHEHAAYLSFFADHAEQLFSARQLLADDASRDLFDQLILFRLLGHLHVRLPLGTPEARAALVVPSDWAVSETTEDTVFGPLFIFQVPVGVDSVWLKCWHGNVTAYLARQYFYDRDGTRIAPGRDDHVVDAGGCFGDTALLFAQHVGPTGHVYTFDPLPRHCAIMHDAIALNTNLADRVTVFPVGLSDVDATGDASKLGAAINPGARIGKGVDIPLRSIDSAVAAGEIDRVDFIKMDIEGSELDALKGAQASLARWRPRLAISLYHRNEDFFTIPRWLDRLHLGYRFHLDHYSMHREETVLYATAVA